MPQQGQCSLDAMAGGQQVGLHDPLQQGRLEMPGVDVLAAAGIEDHAVQRAPVRLDRRGDGTYLFAVGEVARQCQYPPRIASGKRQQRLGATCR